MNILQSTSVTYRKDSGGMFFIFCLSIFFVLTGSIFLSSIQAGPAVRGAEGDEWRYFKGTVPPPLKWTHLGFDESLWLTGVPGFGYGRSSRTYLADMKGSYSTVYARQQFTVVNIYKVTGMTLSLLCDGAFIAYVNGVEVIRNDSAMKSMTELTRQAELLDISGFLHELLPGKNVFSVQCSNDDINSSDFSFAPVLEVLEYQGEPTQ